MAIKQAIELIDGDKFKRALDDLVNSSMAAADKVNGAISAPSSPSLQQYFVTLKGGTQTTLEHGRSVNVLSQAYHILHLGLGEAGIQISNIRGLTALARLGMEGLAVAIGTAVVIALANLEDSIARTKGRLTDLFQSNALGTEALQGLQQTANQLGTTIASVAPGFEALTTAWQRFLATTRQFKFVSVKPEDFFPALGSGSGFIKGVNDLNVVYGNFLKLLRAGRLDQEEATKTATAFFTSLQKDGQLTADALKALPTGTVTLLAQAFGRGIISAEQWIQEVKLAPKPMDQLVGALSRFTDQSQRAFDANAIITYKDVLGEMLVDLSKGFQDLANKPFSNFVINELRGIQNFIRELVQDAKNLKQGLIDVGFSFNKLPTKPAGATGFGTGNVFPGGSNFIVPKAQTDEALNNWNKFEDALKEKNDAVVNDINAKWDDFYKWLTGTANPSMAALDQAFNVIFTDSDRSPGTSLFDSIIQKANEAIQKLLELNDRLNSISANAQSGLPFRGGMELNYAGGGYVSGKGTTTSDSILAWLSNKEFVQPARAVSYYGVGFMEAIRQLRLPRDLFDGFNMGGLVNAMVGTMPRFVGGGMAVAGTPITLNIGGQSFGMTASEDTAKKLRQYAVQSQLSSTGRKPRWVR